MLKSFDNDMGVANVGGVEFLVWWLCHFETIIAFIRHLHWSKQEI